MLFEDLEKGSGQSEEKAQDFVVLQKVLIPTMETHWEGLSIIPKCFNFQYLGLIF